MEPFPASPEPEYRPEGKGPAPASVATAVKLIWIGVAVGLVSAALSFVLLDDIVDQVVDAAPELSESAARGSAIFGVVISVIISVGLAALFAYFINKGANWARIVYTVLGVIGLLFSLPGIGNQPVLFLVLSLVNIALTIATIFFLFRPDANAYFKKA